MSLNPVAKKLSHSLVLAFVTALVFAGAGVPSVAAEEPVPSLAAPEFDAFFPSDADCIEPASAAAELPELFPTPEPKTGSCSPLCGYVPCRGMLVGEACTTSTGAQGTCYGPPLGKKCADGLPMCLCVA